MKVPVKKLSCLRCKHKWVPRTEEVLRCPGCKSVYWNRPRNRKKPA